MSPSTNVDLSLPLVRMCLVPLGSVHHKSTYHRYVWQGLSLGKLKLSRIREVLFDVLRLLVGKVLCLRFVLPRPNRSDKVRNVALRHAF